MKATEQSFHAVLFIARKSARNYERFVLDNLLTDNVVASASQRTSWNFIILNRTFDWLVLKLLESIVLVLSSDWFSSSGLPRFE